jgi:hypothetical protein
MNTSSDDWFENNILKSLRQQIEFKNLLAQLNGPYNPNALTQSPQQPFYNNSNLNMPLFHNPIEIDKENLFGCQAYQCKKCLAYETKLYYFNSEKIIKFEHSCYTNTIEKWLLDYYKTALNYMEQMDPIPLRLKYSVLNQWTRQNDDNNNNNHNFYLYQVRLSSFHARNY